MPCWSKQCLALSCVYIQKPFERECLSSLVIPIFKHLILLWSLLSIFCLQIIYFWGNFLYFNFVIPCLNCEDSKVVKGRFFLRREKKMCSFMNINSDRVPILEEWRVFFFQENTYSNCIYIYYFKILVILAFNIFSTWGHHLCTNHRWQGVKVLNLW